MIEIIKYLLYRETPLFLLKKRGLKLGKNFKKLSGIFIDPTHCWLIEIGNNVTISRNVTILAHDASTKKIINFTKIGKIKIGDNVFIGSGTLILPNTSIGKNCIVGANTVITKKFPDNVVISGNPGKIISTITEFKTKNIEKIKSSKVFDEKYLLKNITKNQKEEMQKIEEIAYIV